MISIMSANPEQSQAHISQDQAGMPDADSPWFEPQNKELADSRVVIEVDGDVFAANVATSMWFVTQNASAPKPRTPSPES